MQVSGGLPYYNTRLYTAYNTCGFHIYLSPYFTNYAVSICKQAEIIPHKTKKRTHLFCFRKVGFLILGLLLT